jgi:hypothetical protein
MDWILLMLSMAVIFLVQIHFCVGRGGKQLGPLLLFDPLSIEENLD